MDFEDAAQRLARDQQKLRGRKTVAVSAKAKREADYRKKQQERIRQQRERQQLQLAAQQKYYNSCERALKARPLASSGTNALELTPTSIWGEGDKIALPPSVLEFLTQKSGDTPGSSPWMFRIGILNSDYKFPASPVLQTTIKAKEGDDSDSEDEDEDDHTGTSGATKEAYLDELDHKYLAYTHATVVEFTQDEGHVGLPAPIAKALLESNSGDKIPTRRTKDPSAAVEDAMQVDDDDNEKTPGHVAYGAFDVPDVKVEITMLELPKGKGCTLTPTRSAIQNGFYNLQNIKLVLEQSLIRTRATLSVGDLVQTWHRGVQFDLVVSQVTPATFQAVTCINTDIEVEFGQVNEPQTEPATMDSTAGTGGRTLSPPPSGGGRTLSSSPPPGGRTLSSSPTPQPPQQLQATSTTTSTTAELLAEPPADQKDNVCTIQIRAGQTSGRRRFDITKATMTNVFEFASTLSQESTGSSFRLVTRFPRRVYENSQQTMAQAGFAPGQELLLLEKM